MRSDQLLLDAAEIKVAADHLDGITAGADIDATPEELRRATELIRAGIYRATVVLRRLQARAESGRVDVGRLVLLVVGILAGLLMAWAADYVGEAPPERPGLLRMVEFESGVWCVVQDGRAVDCHWADGADVFERGRP